jgi:aminoglycoside phosphotransferase (APT) family kinase protein
MPAPDDPGLLADVARRAAAAAAQWTPSAALTEVQPLTGGTSSLTYLATLSGAPDHDRIVLKVAPPGLPPVRNRDVLRQGRVMRALHGHPGVRVPAVLFEDPGAPVHVPPLIAMSFVPGVCAEPYLDHDKPAEGFAAVRQSAFECASVMAAIHRLEPAAIGLADEPVVSLTDEVARWTRAFETLSDDLAGAYAEAEQALLAAVPAALPPVVNHGDFRVGNTLVEDGRVRAVIDWEIWSVGDPRVDLTWMTYFCDEARHPGAANDEPSGMPTIVELEDAYFAARGLVLPDMPWFHALTRYKEAAATGLLIKRARKLGSGHESFDRMEPALPSLLEETHALLAGA